jgi:multisubunit Na+/H+ antiporter MnhB subunit
VELNRLRQGELIAAGGGAALLIVMFLDWYGAGGSATFQGQDIEISLGFNAWQAFSVTDLILALTAVSAIGLAVITASHRSPALPVAGSVITATLGALATLLVFYRILNQPGPNEFFEVKLGAFLGFVSVLAVAVGGWLSVRDEQWEDAPMATDVRPTPPREGPQDPAPPPEAEPRA